MADVTRRAVLGAGLGVAAAVALGGALEDPAGAAVASTALPTRSTYQRAIGRVFTVRHGKHTYRLRLAHVHDLARATTRTRPHGFTLVFAPVGSASGARGAQLPDGIYSLRAHSVAVHTLFLSAIGTGRNVQAVVNRNA